MSGDWLSDQAAWNGVITVIRNHFTGVRLDDARDLSEVKDEDLVRELNEGNALGPVRVDVIPLVTA